MNGHVCCYLVLALAYFEASYDSFAKRDDMRGACREFLIALLYLCIAVLALNIGWIFTNGAQTA
jgi:nitroreductase